MIVITGGAGFIGSNLVAAFNRLGEEEILIVDSDNHPAKAHNLRQLHFCDLIEKKTFRKQLNKGVYKKGFKAIIHQGACSDTRATDFLYVMDNNYEYSIDLLEYCIRSKTRFIYASSSSVYGNSSQFSVEGGFESPLNIYAYSKYLFDQRLRQLPAQRSQILGLRYFNVYGPGEAHKGGMASVIHHFTQQYTEHGRIRLFAGSGGYQDGEQRRDFVSVEDVVSVNLHFYENPQICGIYNLGTGIATSFNQVGQAVINNQLRENKKLQKGLPELQESGAIDYFSMPAELRAKYQSYTQADIDSLLASGYSLPFSSIEKGIAHYQKNPYNLST